MGRAMTVFHQVATFCCYFGAACGMSYPDPRRLTDSPCVGSALRALSLASDVLVWLMMVSLGVKAASPGVPLNDRCIGVFTTMASIKCIAESVHSRLGRRRFDALVSLWERSGKLGDVGEELSKVRNITLLLFSTQIVPACVFSLLPIIPGVRHLVGRRHSALGWFFFDADASPAFEVAAVFHSVSASFTVAKIVAYDCLFLSLAGLHVAQLRRLRRDLEDVFEDLRLGHTGHVMRRLREWILRHQQAAQFGMEFQQLYSPIWIMQFLSSLIIVCFGAFVVIAGTLNWASFVLLMGYASSNLAQLYLLCHCGDRLKESSERLVMDTYGCGWYLCDTEVQCCMKMVFLRCNKVMCLTAMGVMPLSCQTFEGVVKTAASYFMVLWNMRAEVGGPAATP